MWLPCKEGSHEKGLEIRTIIAFGYIIETTLQITQEEGEDLIAMASHGRTGLSRVFHGSLGAGTLHRADRRLLPMRSQVGQ